jgi:hypothetical protein
MLGGGRKRRLWPSLTRSVPVDRTVAQLNIDHYKRLLEQETDETKRATLLRLLAEEEAKLHRSPADKRDPAA